MTPPVMTPEQESEAAILYSEHEWTCPEVAEHFGVSTKTIQRVMHKLGVAMRPKGNPAHTLLIKQCSSCLAFLPVAHFDRRRGQCNVCREHQQKALRWSAGPLTQAIQGWRVQ